MAEPTHAPGAQRPCPDDGRCHHGCGEAPCFRVGFCGPLSGVYPNDQWPTEVTAAEAARAGGTVDGLARQVLAISDPDSGGDWDAWAQNVRRLLAQAFQLGAARCPGGESCHVYHADGNRCRHWAHRGAGG